MSGGGAPHGGPGGGSGTPAHETASPSLHGQFAIPPSHPALPGHFPDAAVVPAVVILEEVLALARGWLGPVGVRGLPQAKFTAPLPPGARADALLRLDGGRLKFRVELAGRTLAQGQFLLAPPDPDPP